MSDSKTIEIDTPQIQYKYSSNFKKEMPADMAASIEKTLHISEVEKTLPAGQYIYKLNISAERYY